MFKIGKLFHLTRVVSDLEAADAWYDEIFSEPVVLNREDTFGMVIGFTQRQLPNDRR